MTGREFGQWLIDHWPEGCVCVAAPAYAADIPVQVTSIRVVDHAAYIPAGGIVSRGLLVVFVADPDASRGPDHEASDVPTDHGQRAESG